MPATLIRREHTVSRGPQCMNPNLAGAFGDRGKLMFMMPCRHDQRIEAIRLCVHEEPLRLSACNQSGTAL